MTRKQVPTPRLKFAAQIPIDRGQRQLVRASAGKHDDSGAGNNNNDFDFPKMACRRWSCADA
jgi:hypothetical protein